MRRTVLLLLVAALLPAAPAAGAQRCDFRGSTTVASNGQARIFFVKGRGADKRVYFGCRRNRRPILLASDTTPKAADAAHVRNDRFLLAGAWTAFRQETTTGAASNRTLMVRSLGRGRALEQDITRYELRNLDLAADGSVAWVLGDGDLREVGGVAARVSTPSALLVARGVDSQSLVLAKGDVRFTLAGESRSLPLAAPAPPPSGNSVGRQGLDGRFGDCGTLVPATPKPGVFTEATQLAHTPTGALVAAGTTSSSADREAQDAERDTFVVSRFAADGKFDASFGKAGIVQVTVPRPARAGDAALTETVVQPDGRVLVAGYVELPDGGAESILLRLTTSGTLDGSFGAGGIARDVIPAADAARIEDLALTPGGAMLVTGQRDNRWFVARVSADGTLDESWGAQGLVADSGDDASRLEAIAVQDDATIFAAGGTGQPLLLRFAPDGTVLSVSSEGPPAAVVLTALEPIAGGGVVAAGTGANIRSAGQLVLARYGADGKPASGFDGDGFVLDPQIGAPNDLAVAPDGALLVTGAFAFDPGGHSGNGLVRYSATGARDTAFGFRGALGGTSSFGLVHHDVLISGDGTAHVAQDNGGAFAISRFVLSGAALATAGDRSSVCAMATASRLGPLVAAGRIDVSLRLRAPGKLRLDAVVSVGGQDIPAGTVTAFRPYTEGAVAAIPLTKSARAALRRATTATLTISAGAPGGKKTAYTVTLER